MPTNWLAQTMVSGAPSPSKPSLPLNAVLLQIAPSNYLHGLGKNRLQFHPFNRGSEFVELSHENCLGIGGNASHRPVTGR